jgi:hypothetical protein
MPNIKIFSHQKAAPKDRHLTYKVMPVLHESCAPPQVMFSTLGIVSPPSIAVVLRQVRALTEMQGLLDSWTYKYGTIEQVFSQIFSCLQGKLFNLKFHRSQAYAFVSFAHSSLIAAPSFTDNFSDLSPRVKEALANRPLVPVGSSFVKANRLFFRLSKDLAPFFYEVPRGKFKLVYIRISNVA